MNHPNSDRARRLVVVGGGLAGMAVALQLARAGFDVALCEAKRRLGGRVGSYIDPETGQAVDYCQHVAMNCCQEFREFIEQLGLLEHWSVERTLHFYSRTGRHLPLRALPLPAPLHLTGLLARWPELSLIGRLRVASGILQLMMLPREQRLFEIAAIDWLRTHGQTHREIEAFWETIIVSALAEKLDVVNLGAVQKVLVDGFAKPRNAHWIWVPKRPLTELFNERAQEALERAGVHVRLQSPSKRLLWRENRVVGVELSHGEIVSADGVVLAVPWSAAWHLLATDAPGHVSDSANLWREMRSSPITGVHLWWDRCWLNTPHAILVRRLCQWIFHGPMEGVRDGDRWYCQIVISASRDLPRGDQAAIVSAVVDDLGEVFPGSRQAQLLRSKVVTDPNAVFSCDLTLESRRPRTDIFSEHRLWLAGDWTDTGWPATMEGAVRSGHRASKSIISAFRDNT